MIFILKTTTWEALRTTALAQTVLKGAFHIVYLYLKQLKPPNGKNLLNSPDRT